MKRIDSLIAYSPEARDILERKQDINYARGLPSLGSLNDELVRRQDRINVLDAALTAAYARAEAAERKLAAAMRVRQPHRQVERAMTAQYSDLKSDGGMDPRNAPVAAEEDAEPKVTILNAPEKIWLVIGEPDFGAHEFDTLAYNREITWCEDSQFADDIAYVRADLVSVPPEVMAALDRMCSPLHESRLSGLTAKEDARCMALIRQHVLAAAGVKA